jgi:hypothetical protein
MGTKTNPWWAAKLKHAMLQVSCAPSRVDRDKCSKGHANKGFLRPVVQKSLDFGTPVLYQEQTIDKILD